MVSWTLMASSPAPSVVPGDMVSVGRKDRPAYLWRLGPQAGGESVPVSLGDVYLVLGVFRKTRVFVAYVALFGSDSRVVYAQEHDCVPA